ncbi:unnamed protein product [Darwinula stevensoni]|uniref:Uncharacterized protein n=1 Tax=Darwinula stevensoni TaxID=69355 RepID=A0A7R9A182_9CRUS|nr:unnamed protein product [Darwinula stevensoni]CAG0887200.1 unnamed protein product [Darwinula stevensoni]
MRRNTTCRTHVGQLPSPKKKGLIGSATPETASSRPLIGNPKMNPLLTVFLLFFPSFVFGITEQTCPIQDISPCKCTKDSDGDVTVDCSNASSGAQISSVLTNASWPSTQLWLFVIEDNTDVVELPEEFGDLSFRLVSK